MTLDLSTMATAASIAMDAFSVSVCMGICDGGLGRRDALTLGGAFGISQFGMPLIGALIAANITGFLNSWAPWIGAGLITWVALNMIREAYTGKDKTNSCMNITLMNVLILAFATSLDALIVGFSIKSSGGSALLLALSAGVITFLLSFSGALGGKKLGEKIGTYAEYSGGIVLILVALNILAKA
ncbi:MAG: manganese efflux pump MntP family protein [Synergistaceae bacterium]|nr:manganese efflux pump MntP family protein [Synergistaceae bacterium]